jgi:hypothetical protein
MRMEGRLSRVMIEHERPKFNLDQSVVYKNRLYKVVAASIEGCTGWRYKIRDNNGNEHNYVFEVELK